MCHQINTQKKANFFQSKLIHLFLISFEHLLCFHLLSDLLYIHNQHIFQNVHEKELILEIHYFILQQ